MDQTQDNSTPKRILVELRRLRRIHDVTMYSFSQTRGQLEEQLARREINGRTPIMSKIAGEERLVASSPLELLPQLSNVYPQILRESLFVRAISQFEVFLVEMVWEIASRTTEPFKQQRTIEYQQARLLSFQSIDELRRDIIQQECRQLTSQGFNYAEGYYQSRFGIRFADAPVNLSEVREMHERRHLLVHKGGRIDQRYQNLFANDLKVGDHIEVSAEYFRTVVETLTKLAEFILASTKSKWPLTEALRQRMDSELTKAWVDHITKKTDYLDDAPQEQRKGSLAHSYLAYWFRAQFSEDSQVEAHLAPDFSYLVGQERYYLSDILVASKRLPSNEAEWIVSGLKSLVGPYVGYQKIMAERDRFEKFEAQRLEF